MTENEIRQKVVATAKKYIGCNEQDGSHKKFIDRYNAFQPLPRNHKMTYNAAWCATFVSAIAIECGLTDIFPVECGCGYMISLYKKLGRWREDENYTPKAGDVIFYDWQDGADYATTDNTGSPEQYREEYSDFTIGSTPKTFSPNSTAANTPCGGVVFTSKKNTRAKYGNITVNLKLPWSKLNARSEHYE